MSERLDRICEQIEAEGVNLRPGAMHFTPAHGHIREFKYDDGLIAIDRRYVEAVGRTTETVDGKTALAVQVNGKICYVPSEFDEFLAWWRGRDG